MPQSHFLVSAYTPIMANKPPVQAARVVLAATRATPWKSIAESVLPGLNPYQPNHRMMAPTAAMVML